MRYLLIAMLSLFSTLAAAQGEPNPGVSAPVTQTDDYTEDLDIAKAVRNTATQDTKAASNACGPVKGHVVYVDSQGVRHELDYVQVGDPCSHS
ncbi:DUF2790 domain-containing protein [Pseudomonas tolaasii]|uniref:DUF2790 domain-containing protein n=2 Tax=Pseudomonas tolaasii TaxID=29442 RepID=A0A7Y8AXC0_PSETO|nr:DUF2790 domain-containing protein [Pseudomonas tolaasii]ARB30110.1 hypothetical protein B5P22_23405 [Pseudomonas tolaasii]KAB0466488.1 DUF2790 domain-containing protein [Pseudomonas tolaasii]MBW1247882.1 DUF2790 domain-containing protein [Pseudomonas tolaasii]MBW4792969.1 DUF2790 domain-containing protein [Pseudomonas tolaasii]MBY8943739.1 DUF2790 domain-containing protein [Pseudomonas tolaasii]